MPVPGVGRTSDKLERVPGNDHFTRVFLFSVYMLCAGGKVKRDIVKMGRNACPFV